MKKKRKDKALWVEYTSARRDNGPTSARALAGQPLIAAELQRFYDILYTYLFIYLIIIL